jgi:hypothetical protein
MVHFNVQTIITPFKLDDYPLPPLSAEGVPIYNQPPSFELILLLIPIGRAPTPRRPPANRGERIGVPGPFRSQLRFAFT